MTEGQIRIEGSSESLKELRRELIDEMGDELKIQPVSSAAPGELREPVLITLIVAVTPIAVDNLRKIIDRYLTHRERMEEIRIYRGDSELEISVEDLRPEEFTS